MTATTAVLTRAALEAWLAGWQPDAVVGLPAAVVQCVFACWLWSRGIAVAAVLAHAWPAEEAK
jgi:hypothetical protein